MSLVLLPILAVAALLFLVIYVRLHAFLSLFLVSLGVGLLAGMSPEKLLKAVEVGMQSTAGYVAIVVGLGSMFGIMLEVSGGAQVLARTLVRWVGIERAAWALTLTGFTVGISVFFDVGFILLVPLIFSLGRETGRSVVGFALPLLAGLCVTHAFLPPHPGPSTVGNMLHADLGKVLVYGFCAGVPGAILAGVFASRFITARIPAPELPEVTQDDETATKAPAFAAVLFLVLVPVVLILSKAVTQQFAAGTVMAQDLYLLGHPFIALSIATLLAFLMLGKNRGLPAAEIQKLADRSLKPAGQIILIMGSGGIFKQVLDESGAGRALAEAVSTLGFSPLVLAFVLALLMRISLGSTTVSMLTAVGLVAPLLERYPDTDPALATVAIASGALACSHVNDSGFWLVKQYLGLTEIQTLKSWTVVTTILGFTGIAVVLILNAVIH